MKPQKSRLPTNGLYFIPLGGSEQFGVNLNVYACDGDLLAIDCGVGFADERHPGIDLLLPDPQFLEEHKDHLKGLIITHAHEDHIGAAAYLWDRLECPLYATPFTAAVLRLKLDEQGLKHVKVKIIEPGKSLSIEGFDLEFLPVAHSIPDACAVLIKTPYGNVMHSGDWNLDPAPVVGPLTDVAAFKRAGDLGILAYIGDSTNADTPGRAGSESYVTKGLSAEFKNCKGRILITVFSSNIGRLHSIAQAAKETGRDIGVVGRSLHRMIGSAKKCGYLNDVEFVGEEDLGYLPDDRVVIVMTGSQGEPRAALPKVARGEHPAVRIRRGDTVIFSARAIPGNELEINAVKNNLVASGVTVVSPRTTKNIIHVSGHPCRDEIAEMYQWVRPQTVIPVHGERMQLEAQAAFASECQIPNVVIPMNGSVIRLAPGKPEITDHVPTGVLAVDQKRIIKSDHQSLIARRKLQFSGTVHVSLVMDGRGQLLADPKLDTVGLVDISLPEEEKFDEGLIDETLAILDDMSWEQRLDDNFVTEELRIGLRRYVFHLLKIKPKTTVHVIRI
jgi:ribonuclease J